MWICTANYTLMETNEEGKGAESSVGSKVFISNGDGIVKPYEGMEFDSEDAAKIFYDDYARQMCIARRRTSNFSEMIAQFNQLVASSIIFSDESIRSRNLCIVWPQFRFLCSSSLDHSPRITLKESVSSTNLHGRVSRMARTEAQDVLFDYLHCTRSFSFTDAEHISKNSPQFLQNLLSKVDQKEDVARSLTKFLRYHPVNEFEPFFESLGMLPSDMPLFLPRHLMFLCDDHLLLENFHILCNYGIPRFKMGKMYKEAKEIFHYDYGIIPSKLQALENLGLSKSTVIKLVSCCPTLLADCINHDFIKIIENLIRLGIEVDWIGRYLSYKCTYNWTRILDTMNFLHKVGYGESQMQDLFKSNPSLLLEGSGRKVYILFGRLLKLGLNIGKLYSLFVQNHQLLSGKCVENLLHAVNFFFEIGMRTKDIAFIVETRIRILSTCSLKGPKTVCKDFKVDTKGLCQIIMDEPEKFFSLACKSKIRSSELVPYQDPVKDMQKTTFLLRLGYIENSNEMMKAIKKFRGRGDQLQERFDCLVKAGLDFNVVVDVVKHAPMLLNQSKDVIQKKIDCLRNCLGYPLDSIVAFPAYLCYNIERINSRFSMYMWLREKGAAKANLSLSSILACSEARFVKYFVDVHPEGPSIWESFKNNQLQA